MSRFTPSRRNQIMAWTGAALAWGTAFVAGKVEPARASQSAGETSVGESAATQSSMPRAPINGLTILRYTPIERPAPEIQYEYVKVPSKPANSQVAKASSGSSGTVSASAPPPPAAAPANAPAPNPPSSGS